MTEVTESIRDAASGDEDAVGWLHKKSSGTHAGKHVWQRRWFVLKGSSLAYYKAPGDAQPRGVLELQGCDVRAQRHKSHDNQFQISHPRAEDTRELYAATASEMEQWLSAIKAAVAAAVGGFEGFLYKKGNNTTAMYKRRWFVLKGSRLYYFERPGEPRPKGFLDVDGATIKEKKSRSHPNRFLVQRRGRPTRDFYSDSALEKTMWMRALQQAAAAAAASGAGGEEAEEEEGEAEAEADGEVAEVKDDDSDPGSGSGRSAAGSMSAMSAVGAEAASVMGDPAGAGANAPPAHQGYLLKKGSGHGGLVARRNWKRRYFVLTATELCYYVAEGGQLKGRLPIAGYEFRYGGGKYDNFFALAHPNRRQLELRAESAAELRAWQAALETALLDASLASISFEDEEEVHSD